MKLLLSTILMLSMGQAYAHGMNKLGPNKGYINMPGTFHTEVVPQKNGEINIYLLDINFEGAMTNSSSVEVSYVNQNEKIDYTCKALKNFFNCSPKKQVDLKKGKLLLKAMRNSVKATNVAEYQLPLSLNK